MFTNYRQHLINVYLNWVNNYLTIDKYAEHNGLTINQAQTLIDLSKEVFNHQHMEA